MSSLRGCAWKPVITVHLSVSEPQFCLPRTGKVVRHRAWAYKFTSDESHDFLKLLRLARSQVLTLRSIVPIQLIAVVGLALSRGVPGLAENVRSHLQSGLKLLAYSKALRSVNLESGRLGRTI